MVKVKAQKESDALKSKRFEKQRLEADALRSLVKAERDAEMHKRDLEWQREKAEEEAIQKAKQDGFDAIENRRIYLRRRMKAFGWFCFFGVSFFTDIKKQVAKDRPGAIEAFTKSFDEIIAEFTEVLGPFIIPIMEQIQKAGSMVVVRDPVTNQNWDHSTPSQDDCKKRAKVLKTKLTILISKILEVILRNPENNATPIKDESFGSLVEIYSDRKYVSSGLLTELE
jgi:hypothetical protein